MKNPRSIRRLGEGHVDLGHDHFVIQLPDCRVLRLIARSVLLAVSIVSFPWIGTVLRTAGPHNSYPSPATGADGSGSIGDVFFLPMLFRDLKRHSLLRVGDRAVFLGDPTLRLPFLKQNKMDPISDDQKPTVSDSTVDFIFAAAGSGGESFSFIDRTLKVGGVATVRLSLDPSEPFPMAPNYKMVYIRRFGATTVVAMRKISPAATVASGGGGGRRLLAVPEAKKAVLNGLEDVLLEPPARPRRWRRYGWRTRYLPELTGDSLDEYPRRVFVDVGSAGSGGGAGWFRKNYPTMDREFEMIRVEVVAEGGGGGGGGGMAEWLVRNVREEEYVVMKAEAEVVEEVVEMKAIGLVDELFLECRHQGQKGKKKKGVRSSSSSSSSSRRAYWECLALYGKLRDEGVAVHQWWG